MPSLEKAGTAAAAAAKERGKGVKEKKKKNKCAEVVKWRRGGEGEV